jgi:hypothetical protein
MVDLALKGLSRSFGKMYPDGGRPSIAPESYCGLFAQVLEQARVHDLLSDEHFSVDGGDAVRGGLHFCLRRFISWAARRPCTTLDPEEPPACRSPYYR